MDEHRLGLKPILRRVWAPRGQRPVVPVQPRYEWLYIYAFAHPNTGRSFYLLMPTVSVEAFSVALHEFATCVGLTLADQQRIAFCWLTTRAGTSAPRCAVRLA